MIKVPQALIDDAENMAFLLKDIMLHPEKYKLPEGYISPEPQHCECCGGPVGEDGLADGP